MDNIWQRRSNSGKLTLTTSSTNKDGLKSESPRTFTSSKRFGGDSSAHGKANPFNGASTTATAAIASPTHGASSAFGLGSGAFASFGSASKTPKTPGGGAASSSNENLPPTPATNKEPSGKDVPDAKPKPSTSAASTSNLPAPSPEHPLKSTWVVWYRPPAAKHLDYEKSTVALAGFGSAEAFWAVYAHLRRPSALPAVSDYHLFRKGVRPVWEDAANKKGGKWIVRLKKGVADRYWEDLLLAIVGDMFGDAGEEVCGAVLSVRQGEDVLSLWTRIDGGRNIKIRETVKRLLAFPPDTNIVWKSHDDSIAQRTAFDQARQEKANGAHAGKRRDTLVEESTPEKARS